MKNALEVIVQPDGITVCHPQENGIDEYINGEDSSFGERMARFCANNAISSSSVVIYASEELLFFKTFDLPLKTPNIKDAVRYQLGVLTPFSNETVLHSYSTIRQKGSYKVNLYATHAPPINTYLQKIIDAGYKLIGLYPESQRYVNRTHKKNRWALLMPGRFNKALVFNGTQMVDRFLCSSEPTLKDLATTCETEIIYQNNPSPESEFRHSKKLLSEDPLLKEFDLLPASLKRPDYSKPIIMFLLFLNVVALFGFFGVKEYRFSVAEKNVDEAISQIMPEVKEINRLRLEEKELTSSLEMIEGLGKNPDLILFLDELTEKLPLTSYLDQVRLDQNASIIQMQGYTEDIGELTTKLADLGEIKLKSTSRRRNETYFHLEVKLP